MMASPVGTCRSCRGTIYKDCTGNICPHVCESAVMDPAIRRYIRSQFREGKMADKVKEIADSLQMPSIGRVVHYVSEKDGRCRAAMITDIHPELGQMPDEQRVTLAIFDQGVFFRELVRYRNPPDTKGTWHWPERV